MSRQPKPVNQARTLSLQEKISAIAQLETRIKELRDLEIEGSQRADDPAVTDLESRISSALANIYGQISPEDDRLQIAAEIKTTIHV